MRTLILTLLFAAAAFSQAPPIEPGVSQELAKWRAARYSDVRYKLNLTLEKMSPVLKGTMEIRVKVAAPPPGAPMPPIILDWRKLPGHEKDSTITNVSLNDLKHEELPAGHFMIDRSPPQFEIVSDHLIFYSGFHNGIVAGENVIKLDFTSPILTSGSAITRYVDKEDGSEYIYSLFVPSDASTAFPVFDQPDLKARFEVSIVSPSEWAAITNSPTVSPSRAYALRHGAAWQGIYAFPPKQKVDFFEETKPISTYVFAFAAGPFARVSEPGASANRSEPPASVGGTNAAAKTASGPSDQRDTSSAVVPPAYAGGSDLASSIYVRKSYEKKFKPHAAEVFRLNREGIKFLETYFDYKFPWPKYDLVLIPEFPFGGMEHAGATFLNESSVVFPTEPTKGDYISRANLIFHETAHQWFGDTVTMRWFDDLWLKEGFAEFMAYKTLEKVMPEANAWKVFYERNKQAAYATDSTKGTTPIYQPIANLSAAKSAYGNIVYRKAPSFLKQAEFYLREESRTTGGGTFYPERDKFQIAVRAFLKKYEYSNAGWEDLVREFEAAAQHPIRDWASKWINQTGVPTLRLRGVENAQVCISQVSPPIDRLIWPMKLKVAYFVGKRSPSLQHPMDIYVLEPRPRPKHFDPNAPTDCIVSDDLFDLAAVFPNYGDYGYGIFLLDDKSRDYVLKNIGSEKDPFLRSMMWGALWDSVREAELDPREYVELAIRALSSDVRSPGFSRPNANGKPPKSGTPSEDDETIVASVLGRVSTAMKYYLSEPPASVGGANAAASSTSGPAPKRSSGTAAEPPAYAGGSDLAARLEDVLLDRLQNAPTAGMRVTFYRAFVNNATTEKGRTVLKEMLRQGSLSGKSTLQAKDKFDIVTRLIVLDDPQAEKLLADLERRETTDDSKRYAFAARAAFRSAENKATFWNNFVNNPRLAESWIEGAVAPFNNIRQSELTLPYLERALAELPNLKRNRKIFFVNNWLREFISGQRDQKALDIVNKFLADNPKLDNDLRLKILENVDLIERAVRIRAKYGKN